MPVERGVFDRLGIERRGELLEAPAQHAAQGDLDAVGAAVVAQPARHCLQRRHASRRLPDAGARQSAFQVRQTGFVEPAGAGIAAVDRVLAQQAGQRTRQHLRAEFAGGRVQPGQCHLRAHAANELGLQRPAQDFLARLPLLLAEIAAAAALRAPQLTQRHAPAPRVQQAADLIHEVIAGGAVALPIVRQGFVRGEDLLHVQRQGARGKAAAAPGQVQPRAQAAQIAGRVGQAVDMVDTHAVQVALGGQPQRQGMNRVEHRRQFHPQRHQRSDVEEAPVVDHVVANPPPGQPIRLAFDQPQQPRVADAGLRIEFGHPLAQGRRRQRRQRLWAQQEGLVVVAQLHVPVRIELQPQHAGGHRLGAGAVQHRQPELAIVAGRAPIEVEPAGVAAAAAVAQHVPPPSIAGMGGQVIRHQVQDQAHAEPRARRDKATKASSPPSSGLTRVGSMPS